MPDPPWMEKRIEKRRRHREIREKFLPRRGSNVTDPQAAHVIQSEVFVHAIVSFRDGEETPSPSSNVETPCFIDFGADPSAVDRTPRSERPPARTTQGSANRNRYLFVADRSIHLENMASTLSMSGLTARVSAMQRPGVPANRGSRVVAAARPAVVRPRSIVPGMTSSRVAMAVRADASKPAGSNGAKLATVAQPAVEAESVPGKSKFVVPALAFAAAAAALTPAAPASAAAAVVATVNQADTAWILISTGESARASDACPASE